MTGIDELVAVVAALRAEGGCPWDRAQTEASMRPYLLEEAYELLAAIDRGEHTAMREELGDLLFVVALIGRIAEERGAFSLDAAAAGIARKMIERHPHVFGGVDEGPNAGTIEAWEARKAKARPRDSALDGVPDALPALLRAHRIGEKASRVGFDWPDRASVRMKVDEELAELNEALETGDDARITEEFGDLLFSLVNLGRFLPASSEDALRLATAKFEGRFRAVEAGLRAEGRSVHATAAEELERRWQAVKAGE